MCHRRFTVCDANDSWRGQVAKWDALNKQMNIFARASYSPPSATLLIFTLMPASNSSESQTSGGKIKTDEAGQALTLVLAASGGLDGGTRD
jgi:hypothetical protein